MNRVTPASRRPWITIVAWTFAFQGLAITASAQPPDFAVHDIKWYVHDSLIDGANPLSSYQALIEQASENAAIILTGDSGPFDTPCCTDVNAVSVNSFSDSGGNTWSSINSKAEFDNLDLVDATGTRAFIVSGITVCGMSVGNPIGCATTPLCGSNSDDLTIVIDIAADRDFGVFANTLAHERGHNACLEHVFANSCELMGGSSGGDCVSTNECDEFREERTSTGALCACHSSPAVIAPDGTACSEPGTTGICSGGICGAVGSDASVTLVASAGTSAQVGDTPNDPLVMSGIPGGWTDGGEFSSGYTPHGLAFADDRGITYAVSPTVGDDVLLQINPADGSASLVGSINGVTDLRGLAYNPGATASTADDHLFAIGSQTFAGLYEIDPDDASSTLLGTLRLGGGSGFNGLAYDSRNDRLYASSQFTGGIYEIDPACDVFGSQCETTMVNADGPGRSESGIAYSPTSNTIYVAGGQNGPRTLYDTLDADALAVGSIVSGYTRGLDGFTLGGLAATSVPEPGFEAGAMTAAVCLLGLRRLRRR